VSNHTACCKSAPPGDASVHDDSAKISLPCVKSITDIRPEDERGVKSRWPNWIKKGTNVRPVDPDDPRAGAGAADTQTGAVAMDDSKSCVQITELITTAFSNVQEYTKPTQDNIPPTPSNEDVNMVPPKPPTPLNAFASIKEIAQFHNLCEKQYYAFLLMATVLLHYKIVAMYGQDTVDAACEPPDHIGTASAGPLPNSELRDIMKVIKHLLGTQAGSHKVKQLIMFVGGEAGSGKTEITKAITTLAKQWNLTHVLHKTATTGAAASLINGCTIHHLGKLMYKHDNVIYDPNLKIALAIIDEVSMLKRSENGTLTKMLQKMLDKPGKVLGDVLGTCVPLTMNTGSIRACHLSSCPPGSIRACHLSSWFY
jgi:hypothetical protein